VIKYNRQRSRLLILLLLFAGALPSAVTSENDSTLVVPGANTPEPYSSSGSPLQLPRLLWNTAIYPVGEFTIYAEHHDLTSWWYQMFMNKSETFGLRPTVAKGGETGNGYGFSTFVGPNERRLQMTAIYSGDYGKRANASFNSKVGKQSLHLGVTGSYLDTRHPEASINGALRANPDRQFATRRGNGQVRLGWRSAGADEDISRNVSLDGMIGYAYTHFWDQTQVSGPLVDPGSTIEARTLQGLDEPLQLVSVGGRLVLDSRDYMPPFSDAPHPLYGHFPGEGHRRKGGKFHPHRNTSYAERGALLSFEGAYIGGTDAVRYMRSSIEAQAYVTLLKRARVLALRARIDQLHPIGTGIIPFTELRTLGGNQDQRGYHSAYFRGWGTLAINIEYRYPIWDTWNAYFFWDEGQVFDRMGDLSADNFTTSWGGGLALRSANRLVVKVQIGHSAVQRAVYDIVLGQAF
jgi:hypothetical protein